MINDKQALDIIQNILSGNEWNADTLDDIAAMVRATGRAIVDLNDEEDKDNA